MNRVGRKIFYPLYLLLATVVVIACGGGGGGGTLAGGGIGGTGIGTITGFGSIHINNESIFLVNDDPDDSVDDTLIYLDGDPIARSQLENNSNIGLIARVLIADDVSDDFSSGTAVSISVNNIVKGPVTGTDPLEVMGQTVVVNGSTALVSTNGIFALDEILEVAGYADSANVIQATRIESKAGGILVWKLSGVVGATLGNTFTIGKQVVDLGGVLLDDCVGGVGVGDLVEVKATPDPDLTVLDTVTDVECKLPGLDVPAGSGASLEAEVEGIVTSIAPPDGFTVNGQPVLTSAATLYEGGEALDIVVGVKLEVEGRLNTATGVLEAEEIEFRETRVRVEAPVQPGDVDTVSRTLTIMNIAVVANALTEDDGNILALGLAGSRQIEVNGYIDGGGQVVATEIKETGDPDSFDVRLRGLVSAIDSSSSSFEILGVAVDVSTAVTIIDERVEPPASLTQLEFFNSISAGDQVQIEKGTYLNPGNPANDSIILGEIEIED